MSMKHVRMRDGQFDDIPQVGFFAALKDYRKDLALGLLPWTGDDYVEIFDAVVELVKTLGPVLIVVDPLFAPAVDVCRYLRWRHVLLGAGGVKDHVVKWRLSDLMKYPM